MRGELGKLNALQIELEWVQARMHLFALWTEQITPFLRSTQRMSGSNPRCSCSNELFEIVCRLAYTLSLLARPLPAFWKVS